MLHSALLYFIILSGVRLSPLGTAATTGLLYQPQMIDDGDCGAIGGMKIGSEIRRVLGENLHQRHFVHHKSYTTDPGSNPGRCGGKPATNCLSYGAAFRTVLNRSLT
jgi:hypothetical protein